MTIIQFLDVRYIRTRHMVNLKVTTTTRRVAPALESEEGIDQKAKQTKLGRNSLNTKYKQPKEAKQSEM